MTKIMPCQCKNEGQDALHGKGIRVFNVLWLKTNKPSTQWRCTVCSTLKESQ